MKRSRNTAEKILRKLKIAAKLIAESKTVYEVYCVNKVTQPTYRCWSEVDSFFWKGAIVNSVAGYYS